MTEQTPKERLEDLLSRDRRVYDPELLYEATLAYRDHAEARIKELEVEMEKLIQLAALQAEQISRMPSQEKLNDN